MSTCDVVSANERKLPRNYNMAGCSNQIAPFLAPATRLPTDSTKKTLFAILKRRG